MAATPVGENRHPLFRHGPFRRLIAPATIRGMNAERKRWPPIADVWRFIVVLTIAGWWGALTFYGAVVVPEGTEQLGSQIQGLVTQQVTRTLNLVGDAVIVLLFFELRRTGTRGRWAAWITFVVCQIVLYAVHAWLSALLQPAEGQSVDRVWFYDVHRIYLLTTAVQWAIGPWLLWGVLARETASVTRDQT